MRYVSTGVTRHVFLTRHLAVKVPRGVRGYIANQSEWRQRKLPHVARPYVTLLHLIAVYPRATFVPPWDWEWRRGPWNGEVGAVHGDECKPSSWGWYPTHGWRLIDYDRGWHPPRRGLIVHLYYARQDRLGRRWSRLRS